MTQFSAQITTQITTPISKPTSAPPSARDVVRPVSSRSVFTLTAAALLWLLPACSTRPAVAARDVVLAQQAKETAELSMESVSRDLATLKENNRELQNLVALLRRRAAAAEQAAEICGHKAVRHGVKVAPFRTLPPAAALPGS